MEKKKYSTGKFFTVYVTMAITFFVTIFLAFALFLTATPAGKLVNAKSYILNHSLNTEITDEELEEAAIMGMIGALDDPHAMYLDKESYSRMFDSFTAGEYVGIGMSVSMDYRTNTVTVTSLSPNSPAEKAGIKQGDILVSFMGEEVTAQNFNELSYQARSKNAGDEVEVAVIKEGESEPTNLTLVLEIIKNNDVESEIIDGKYALIKILEFEVGTADEFKEELEKATQAGVEGLILDVRHNPGGLVDEVVPVLDMIMDEGVIATVRDSSGETVEEYYSDGKEKTDLPIIVFADNRSASSSELLAGTLQDTDRATVIGETTFGKAVGQTIFPLGDGTGLYFSHMKVFLPSGISIDGVGVVPDYEVSLADDVNVYTLDAKDDPYVKKAIELFNK